MILVVILLCKPLRALKKHKIETIPSDLSGYIASQTTKDTQGHKVEFTLSVP